MEKSSESVGLLFFRLGPSTILPKNREGISLAMGEDSFGRQNELSFCVNCC